MKAIVYSQHGLPTSDPHALYETEVPTPEPGPHDLRVRIEAISVNPVDTKLRRGVATTTPRILGWDAAGVVDAVGSAVTRFKVGEAVYYAGSIARPGAYAEYGLVDERIAGHRPRSLPVGEAAAIPLTALTAWELLFDRLEVPEHGGAGDALLIIGGAGGVGSMLTQLARKLTGLRVIATASRPETQAWVRELGAHDVIDHSKPLTDGLQKLGLPGVRYVAGLTQTEAHYPQIIEVLAPQGKLGVIDDPATLDVMPLKRKAVSFHWELMFTRALYETPDMVRQHDILERVATLIDEGTLRTTVGAHGGRITAQNLLAAHAVIESGQARGKIVLEGF